MASVRELETALLNAHNAGDSGAARQLVREIEVARRQERLNVGNFRSAIVDPPEPTVSERISRGVHDGIQGAKQAYLMATDAAAAERYRGEVNADEARYQAGRGKDAGFDLARLAGNVLAGAPLAAAVTAAAPASMVGAGASLLARVGLGAIQGGLQGGLTYAPEGTWKQKGQQTAIGTAGGAAGPLMGEVGARLTARGVEAGRTLLNRANATPERIVEALEPVLAARGVKWGELSQQVRDGMLGQARRQLSIEGELAPEALLRKTEMEEILGAGAGPTRGQVLRERPGEWSWERNTSKLQDIGDPLTQRYQAQLQRLRDRTRELIEGMGGRARNDFQAGASATGAVQQKMDDSKKVVDALYTAFRDTGAGNAEVKAAPIASRLGVLLDEYGIENIPSPVANRLREYGMLGGQQKKLLTVNEAEKLRKLIGNNMPGNGTPPDKALRILRDAVDEAVIETDAPGVPALQTARDAARTRFSIRDSAAGVTAAAKDDAPDKFFSKYVLNGNVGDLRGLKATLNTGVMGQNPTPGMVGYEPAGAQAWRDLKGRVVEHIAERAMVTEGSFSGAALRKALKELGDERLKLLFEPAELEQLRKLDRVAFAATVEPAFAAVNHSNTATAGAQYLRDAGRAIPRLAEAATGIPLVGKMAAGAWSAGDEMARAAEMRRRVGQALMGDAFDPNIVAARRTQLAKLLASRTEPFAATLGAESGLYFTR